MWLEVFAMRASELFDETKAATRAGVSEGAEASASWSSKSNAYVIEEGVCHVVSLSIDASSQQASTSHLVKLFCWT